MSDKEIHSTTQSFLDVYDITNDMVILKDGTVSCILQIGTMNFSLLAEQEQDAVIYTYGSLLNSLNFPIQINIQSQTKDATRYLRLLDEQIQKATSNRKANLIRRYQAFVSDLIRERNVLEKKFYVIIPASPTEMGLYTAQNVLPGKTQFDITSIEKTVVLEKAANILEPRVDHLISQFNRLGLFARQLDTQEIIRNFYINYNPEAAEGQEITKSDNYTTPMVRASFSKNLMESIKNNTKPTYESTNTANVLNSAIDSISELPDQKSELAGPLDQGENTPSSSNANFSANESTSSLSAPEIDSLPDSALVSQDEAPLSEAQPQSITDNPWLDSPPTPAPAASSTATAEGDFSLSSEPEIMTDSFVPAAASQENSLNGLSATNETNFSSPASTEQTQQSDSAFNNEAEGLSFIQPTLDPTKSTANPNFESTSFNPAANPLIPNQNTSFNQPSSAWTSPPATESMNPIPQDFSEDISPFTSTSAKTEAPIAEVVPKAVSQEELQQPVSTSENLAVIQPSLTNDITETQGLKPISPKPAPTPIVPVEL